MICCIATSMERAKNMEQSAVYSPFGLERAMKPFELPLGLASPMWMAYGAAASVGATWWWMSRMTRFVAPKVAETSGPITPEAVAAPVLAVVETPVAVVEAPIAGVAAVAESLLEQADELTLLRGVGPRVADALVARGVTTFAQLASWTEEELAAFDAELKLLGRSKRYDFIGQARELAAA
jgi:predicted flap endonuclease-1-like 5' DNA nuclease